MQQLGRQWRRMVVSWLVFDALFCILGIRTLNCSYYITASSGFELGALVIKTQHQALDSFLGSNVGKIRTVQWHHFFSYSTIFVA